MFFFLRYRTIHHWNIIYFNCTLFCYMCSPAFFLAMAGKSYFCYKGPLGGGGLIGFIAFLAATHLFPLWSQPPYSLWAVPLLLPCYCKQKCQTVADQAIWSLFDKRHDRNLTFHKPADAFENMSVIFIIDTMGFTMSAYHYWGYMLLLCLSV